ncbi:MAG: hypothetical protein JWR07_4083 [Nevskia sp.]|nr:hypothetical protein [Nevskia sp.]
MALVLQVDNSKIATLGDFVEFVRSGVDLTDTDSIASAAPMLRSLANDHTLVVDHLNRLVKERFRKQAVPSAQVVVLAAAPGFYVRANIWPSNADVAAGRVYQDQFAYNVAHDHNYNFLTVGYYGPGYVTDLYEYDFEKIEGFPGEKVDLRFVETLHFKTGMVMLYRASKDVHLQHPPNDLSLTLNLLVAPDTVRLRDQYYFDLEKSTLLNFPNELNSSMRGSLLRIAAQLGDGNTEELLHDLAARHPCRRTRLAAYEALVQMRPTAANRLWELAAADPEPYVAKSARQHLAPAAA